MTGIVVVITNYYTSTRYAPVRKIAKASQTGHATNIIAGLAIGQHATALPVGLIGIAILFSFHFAGLYVIAISVLSMLSIAAIVRVVRSQMAANTRILLGELNAQYRKSLDIVHEPEAGMQLVIEVLQCGLRNSIETTSPHSPFKSVDTLNVNIITGTFRTVIR